MMRSERHIYERHIYEEEYAINEEGCYILEVQHPKSGKWLCLDATRRVWESLGRLINHSHTPSVWWVGSCGLDFTLRWMSRLAASSCLIMGSDRARCRGRGEMG